jgi:hypothetical protein
MNRVAAVASAAGVALVFAGCGSGHHGPASYLDRAPNGAVFVQWTRDGSNVNGTLAEAYTDASDPLQLKSENEAFHGVVNGSSVTLTFDQGFGTSTNWNGTLDGDNMTLTYTSDGGTVKTLPFQPGTIDDYNAAVADTQHRVAVAQHEKAKVDAAAAVQAQQQASEQAVDADAGVAASDITDLQNAAAAPSSDLPSTADDVRSMRGDVQTAANDLETTRHAGKYDTCSDADTVSSDADTMLSDQDTLVSDQDTLGSDFDSIVSTIQQLQSDWSKLKQEKLASPGYTPSDVPSATDVANAIAAAKRAMQAARGTMNGYLSTGRGLVAEANGYAAQAQQVCSSSG